MNNKIRRNIYRCFEVLFFPFLWVVSRKIDEAVRSGNKNISIELQRRALVSSADYVSMRMRRVPSVASSRDVMRVALDSVRISGGLYLEFGVFEGSSVSYIASKVSGLVYGFDSFEGLPEWWRDGFGRGKFSVSRMPRVPRNVVLIKGWFSDTLPDFVNRHQAPIALLHVDCDLYSSTVTVLKSLRQQIIPGTVIVFDEYFNYHGWENGEFKAFKEFVLEACLECEYVTYNGCHEQVCVRIVESKL